MVSLFCCSRLHKQMMNHHDRHMVKGRDIMKMALNEKAFNESRSIAASFSQMRESELEKLIADKEPYDPSADDNDPSKHNIANAESTCIWYSFIQPRPVPGFSSQKSMNQYEAELLNPTGVLAWPATHSNKDLKARSFIYSPNCGLALDVDEMEGLKVELFHIKSIRYCVMMIAVCAGELWMTLLQVEYSGRVPSSYAKVSLISMGMLT